MEKSKKRKLYQPLARDLRNNMTETELKLWSRLRRQQIKGAQFYRQMVVGNYIVDFYCPSRNLIIEVDGGQHYDEDYIEMDKQRDKYLNGLGFKVLRFDNIEVAQDIDEVMDVIFREMG